MLPFNPKDKMDLYKSYMPFVKNGGVYVTTAQPYSIGTQVFLLAKLPDTNERFPIVGEIVWVNRSHSVTRPAGIGVRFTDIPENAVVRDKIEKTIAGIPRETPTYTM